MSSVGFFDRPLTHWDDLSRANPLADIARMRKSLEDDYVKWLGDVELRSEAEEPRIGSDERHKT